MFKLKNNFQVLIQQILLRQVLLQQVLLQQVLVQQVLPQQVSLQLVVITSYIDKLLARMSSKLWHSTR